MRDVNARVINRGVRLENNGREWSVNSLVYADDTTNGRVTEGVEEVDDRVCRDGWEEEAESQCIKE